MAGKKQKYYTDLQNQRGDRRRVGIELRDGSVWYVKPASLEHRRLLMTAEERQAEAAEIAAAHFEEQFASLSPKQQVAYRKRRDALGRFVACEPGERITADSRAPRKRKPAATEKPKRRRWRKSQASIIREQMRAAGQ